jgi:hypothetical protein
MFGMKRKVYCRECKKQWPLTTIEDLTKLEDIKLAAFGNQMQLVHALDGGQVVMLSPLTLRKSSNTTIVGWISTVVPKGLFRRKITIINAGEKE